MVKPPGLHGPRRSVDAGSVMPTGAVPALKAIAWKGLMGLLGPVLGLSPIPQTVLDALLAAGVPLPLLAALKHHDDLRANPHLPLAVNLGSLHA